MPTTIDPPTSPPTATSAVPCIHVIDDDVAIQALFRRLCAQAGHDVRTYGTVGAFRARPQEDRPGCLVLDLMLPDGTGIDLLRELAASGNPMPVVFMTGMGRVDDAVQALRVGGLDFVEKPFDLARIREAVQRGVALDLERRRHAGERTRLLQRFASLSTRETEIMDLVVQGTSNKAVAWQLGLSPKTVEVHRANVMRKTGAQSLAELVRLHVAAQPGRPGPAAPHDP
ncbi:MAG: response regulator transcription factor [Planctomycetes bacterium]|nr:response regulator transcription factor [Planctomycetota bacterium]